MSEKLEFSYFNVNNITSHQCESIIEFDKETSDCIYEFLNLEKEALLKVKHAPVKQQFFLVLLKMKTGVID